MDSVDVVVIDDDESVLWVMGQLLTVGGITYRTAQTGPEGLELVDRLRPRLAIIDVKLGGMSGLDVVQRLCDRGVRPGVIFVTGYRHVLAGKTDGLPVIAIVEKPFEAMELLDLVVENLGEPA